MVFDRYDVLQVHQCYGHGATPEKARYNVFGLFFFRFRNLILCGRILGKQILMIFE